MIIISVIKKKEANERLANGLPAFAWISTMEGYEYIDLSDKEMRDVFEKRFPKKDPCWMGYCSRIERFCSDKRKPLCAGKYIIGDYKLTRIKTPKHFYRRYEHSAKELIERCDRILNDD